MAALAQRASRLWRWFSQAADDRPHAQLSSSLIAMLAATGVALAALVETRFGGIFCTVDARLAGANIQRALDIVIVAGLVGSGAAILARNRPRLRVLNLLFAAAALVGGVVLVAVDSGVSKEITTCSFFGTSTSVKTHNVFYLYFIWIPALVTIAVQAARDRRTVGDWRPGLALLVIVPAALVAGLVQAVHPSTAGKTQQRPRKKAGPPAGVFVCRDSIPGPEALGGDQCPKDVDVGMAPIKPPGSLMCVSDLTDVEDKSIGVQVFYGRTLIRHATLHSTDADTEVYVAFDSSYIDGLPETAKLPDGLYRCRILVEGKLLRSRTIQVGRVTLTKAPLQYHYMLSVQTLKRRPHGSATHLGDSFWIVISSRDLPRKTMVPVDVCVNGRGGSCMSCYVLRSVPTRVQWDVTRGEGVGTRYRISVRIRGKQVTRHDLRLVQPGRA
jgi:hypothetical protein